MICRHLSPLLGLTIAACTTEVPVWEQSATVGEAVTLAVREDLVPSKVTTFRWELVTAPEGSATGGPHGEAPTSSFVPDRRGTYLVDRWLVEDLSEHLTYHIIVNVAGVAPEAQIRGDFGVARGATARLDGSSSRSIEARPLVYRWRLAGRPLGSHATLATDDAVQCTLATDVVGDYPIELTVFDGELWSEPPAMFIVSAH